jgi:hypothetical protein
MIQVVQVKRLTWRRKKWKRKRRSEKKNKSPVDETRLEAAEFRLV